MPPVFKNTFRILACLLFSLSAVLLSAQKINIDSLKQLADNATNDSVKVKRMLELSAYLKPGPRLMKLKEALNYARQKDTKWGTAVAEARIGHYFMFTTVDYPLATYWTSRALKTSLDYNYKNTEAQCYQQLGIISHEFEDEEAALSYFHKARRINEQAENNTKPLRTNYSMIGLIYKTLGKSDSAMLFYRKSEQLSIKGNIPVSVVYVNMTSCFISMNMVDSARKFIRLTDSAYKAIKNNSGIYWTAMLKGQLEMKLGNVKTALQLFREAYPAAVKTNDTELLSELLPSMVEALKQTGDYKEAFLKLSEYNALRGSINGTKKSAHVMAIRKKFEEEQAAEIQQLKHEKIVERQQAKIQGRNRIIWGALILLVIVSVFGFLVLRGYRQKKKANKEIIQQKALIEEKQKEILDSIHYARRIQRALITSEQYIQKNLERLSNGKFKD